MSRKTRNKVEELGEIELLIHPLFSPELAPLYYYVFRFISSFFR